MASSSRLFGSDLWNRALESYGSAAHLTIKLFDSNARVVLGPIHPTPLFQLFEETSGYDPGLFAECARRCLALDKERSAVMVSEFCGLSVIGTSLVLNGEKVGAAVGGYAFTDFFQVSEIQRLARDSNITFERLWEVTRAQQPIPQHRLILNGDLLQVLGDALLRENYHTRESEQSALKLEEAGREKDKANDALGEAVSALGRMNQDLKQFAFAASHDLQEPLRMVTSYTQLLAKEYQGKLGKDADTYIGYAVEGAQRIEALLKDLRTYWAVNEDSLDERVRVDCNATLATALRYLAIAANETGAMVTHDPLPAVMAEETPLVQLFQNLVSNALKYRRVEPLKIHISAQYADRQWNFSVSDNGIGIEEEHLEGIFAPFKRLHGREIPGSGIGLAICQKIVERYGGRIWAESEYGTGSTFHFTIPADKKTTK